MKYEVFPFCGLMGEHMCAAHLLSFCWGRCCCYLWSQLVGVSLFVGFYVHILCSHPSSSHSDPWEGVMVEWLHGCELLWALCACLMVPHTWSHDSTASAPFWAPRRAILVTVGAYKKSRHCCRVSWTEWQILDNGYSRWGTFYIWFLFVYSIPGPWLLPPFSVPYFLLWSWIWLFRGGNCMVFYDKVRYYTCMWPM